MNNLQHRGYALILLTVLLTCGHVRSAYVGIGKVRRAVVRLSSGALAL